MRKSLVGGLEHEFYMFPTFCLDDGLQSDEFIFFQRGWNHPPDPENSRSMGTCSMAFDFPAEDMSNALQVPNPYAPRLLHPEPNGPNGPNGQARGDMTCQVSWSIRYFCWWVNIGDYTIELIYIRMFFSATLGIDFLTNQYNGMPSLDVVFMAHLLNRVSTRWWPPSDVCWFIQPTKDVCIHIYVYNCIYIYKYISTINYSWPGYEPSFCPWCTRFSWSKIASMTIDGKS